MTEGDMMNSINSSCLFPKQAAATATDDDTSSNSKDHGAGNNSNNTLIVLDQHDFHLDKHKMKKNNGIIKAKVSKKDVDTRKKLLLMKIPKGLDIFDTLFQEEITTKAEKKKNSGTGNDTTAAAAGAAGRSGGGGGGGNGAAAGGCYVLSNSNGSTLICNNQSYQMSIVGTSNALVLVPPPPPPSSTKQGQLLSTTTARNENDNNDDVQNDDDDNPSPIKKLKFTTTTTASTTTSSSSPTKKSTPSTTTMTGRLVHVGGSGASFIELKPKSLPPANEIMSICRSNNNNNNTGSNNNDDRNRHHHHNDLSVIALQLQCSVQELLHVLQHVPSIVAYPKPKSSNSSSGSSTGSTGTDESSTSSFDYYSYIMLDESQIYDVYNAILSTLCEASCCMNHYNTDGGSKMVSKLGQIPVEDTVTEIVQRLQQEEFKVFTNTSAAAADGGCGGIGIDDDNNKAELLLLRHIARHLLIQLRRSTSTESDDKDDNEHHNTPKKDKVIADAQDDDEDEGMMTLDAGKIAKWVWDGLWIERTTWKEQDILDAFLARLPGIISTDLDDITEMEEDADGDDGTTTGKDRPTRFYHSGLIPTQEQFEQVATRHVMTGDDSSNHNKKTTTGDANTNKNASKSILNGKENAVIVWERK